MVSTSVSTLLKSERERNKKKSTIERRMREDDDGEQLKLESKCSTVRIYTSYIVIAAAVCVYL